MLGYYILTLVPGSFLRLERIEPYHYSTSYMNLFISDIVHTTTTLNLQWRSGLVKERGVPIRPLLPVQLYYVSRIITTEQAFIRFLLF